MKSDERIARKGRWGDGATGRRGDEEKEERKDAASECYSIATPPRRPVAPSLCLSVFLSLCLAGCSRPNPEAEKRAAVDEFFAQARSCWPPDGNGGEDTGNPKLAIESIESASNATRVRLVAYARDKAVDFYLPIYRMSAGRWLINEKGRAYLLNEQCREFKLNDAAPSPGSSSDFLGGKKIPSDGRIRLNPRQAFEATLVFPPLSDQMRVGALVYDGLVLPFAPNQRREQ